MNILTALIIIGVILVAYLFATQITVIHEDTLTGDERKELKLEPLEPFQLEDNSRGYIDNSLDTIAGDMDKYASRQFNSRNYKRNYADYTKPNLSLPNSDNLRYLIRSEYIDQDYPFRFNAANKPVMIKTPGKLDQKDKKYMKQIEDYIDEWNNIFRKYYACKSRLLRLTGLKLISIQETDYDFLIHVMVKMIYQGSPVYWQLEFYGTAIMNYQFINDPDNPKDFMISLTDIKPITAHQYSEDQPPVNWRNGKITFPGEQIDYAKEIYDISRKEYSF